LELQQQEPLELQQQVALATAVPERELT